MLVGRTEQIITLREQIGAVLAGREGPNTFIVTGEAGIGKTTLLNAVREKLLSSPIPPAVISTECSTPLAGHDIGEVEALAPWLGIIEELAGEENELRFRGRTLVEKLALAWVRCIPVIGDVLESAADTAMIIKQEKKKKKGEKGASPVSAGNQEQMFRQCINLMAAVAAQEPLVILLDDMHWADTSSTNLLFAAARELQGKPVAFVVAYRPDEAAVSRAGAGHPILQVIAELERYSLTQHIPVPFLDEDQLRALLRNRYSDYRSEEEFEKWLLRISSGNALFITQFSNTLEEDQRVDSKTGRLLRSFYDVETPDSTYAVVRERIRRLDDDARELLRYASVEGEVFTSQMLGQLSDMNRLQLLKSLRLIEEKHRILHNLGKKRVYARETTVYKFSHALIQKGMYEGLTEEEREVLHEMMLELLLEEQKSASESGLEIREIAPRIATHAEILGKYRVAAEAAMEGAEASWEELAVEETLRQVEQGLEYLHKAEREGRFDIGVGKLEAKSHRILGRIYRYRGEYDRALECSVKAEELSVKWGDSEQEVGALIDQANSLRYLARFEEAEEVGRRALDKSVAIDYESGQGGALNSIGTILYSMGRREEATEVYLQAIDIHQELGEITAQAQTLSNLGNVFNALNQTDEAIRCYERSLELSAESDNMVSYGVALLHLGNMANKREEWGEAVEYYEQSMEIGERIGYRELQTRSITNMGIVLRKKGELLRSRELLQQAETLAQSWARDSFLADLYVEFARLDREEAEQSVGSERLDFINRSREFFQKGLKIYRELNHERVEVVEEELGAVEEVVKDSQPVSQS